MARWLGWGALAYWVVMGFFLHADLYHSWPMLGWGLKLLCPLACLANLFGLITALSLWNVRRHEAARLFFLHGPPMAAVAFAVWWLFFAPKM